MKRYPGRDRGGTGLPLEETKRQEDGFEGMKIEIMK